MESNKLLVLIILLSKLFLGSSLLADSEIDESVLKAMFTYKFGKFTQWPVSRLKNDETRLNLCILGKDSLTNKALNAVKNKEVAGRRLRIERFQSGLLPREAVESCHILFVSLSERKRLLSILSELNNQPILTISDIKNFSQSGGMITLKLLHQQLRFEINPSALQRAQLSMSSKIMELSTHIAPQNTQGEQ